MKFKNNFYASSTPSQTQSLLGWIVIARKLDTVVWGDLALVDFFRNLYNSCIRDEVLLHGLLAQVSDIRLENLLKAFATGINNICRYFGIFRFNWNQVTSAFWTRYPNPFSRHVLSEDIVSRWISLRIFRQLIVTFCYTWRISYFWNHLCFCSGEILALFSSSKSIVTYHMQPCDLVHWWRQLTLNAFKLPCLICFFFGSSSGNSIDEHMFYFPMIHSFAVFLKQSA